jgi:thymidylate synthase
MNKWSNYGKWRHPKQRNKYMNTLDKQYQDLLQDILDNGTPKSDRTGTGTISVFGRQIRHNMKEGFPLLTTKKMPFKTIVTELLWFLRGDTNIKYLVDNNCHIWDGDAYKNYENKISKRGQGFRYMKELSNGDLEKYSQEEFIDKIKTDDEFANKWGELGPIYGAQWRSWGKTNYNTKKTQIRVTKVSPNGYSWKESQWVDEPYGFYLEKIDQIQNLINKLKINPDSRRLMVNAWNVGELDQTVLPPCHYGFQVYTRELSLTERRDLVTLEKYESVYNGGDSRNTLSHSEIDQWGYPTRAISLMWNQRSVDTFLGLPFNIASYGLLLEIIAKEVNMVPDQLIGNLGDVHLYLNHIEQAKEQIGREYALSERVRLSEEINGNLKHQTSIGMSYIDDTLKIPKRTREPFPLPTLKFSNWYKNANEEQHSSIVFNDWIKSLKPDDFILENYQSHPTIKAPLSN